MDIQAYGQDYVRKPIGQTFQRLSSTQKDISQIKKTASDIEYPPNHTSSLKKKHYFCKKHFKEYDTINDRLRQSNRSLRRKENTRRA